MCRGAPSLTGCLHLGGGAGRECLTGFFRGVPRFPTTGHPGPGRGGKPAPGPAEALFLGPWGGTYRVSRPGGGGGCEGLTQGGGPGFTPPQAVCLGPGEGGGRGVEGSRGTPAWGDEASRSGGGRCFPHGPTGRLHPSIPGHTAWGDGESSPRGGRSILHCPWGRHDPSGKPGTPAWGDGEPSPGGGRSILQSPWGGSPSRKTGLTGLGRRGVQPRGWSEHPFRPMGRHDPSGKPGPPAWRDGESSPGVVGASSSAHGEE